MQPEEEEEYEKNEPLLLPTLSSLPSTDQLLKQYDESVKKMFAFRKEIISKERELLIRGFKERKPNKVCLQELFVIITIVLSGVYVVLAGIFVIAPMIIKLIQIAIGRP